MRRCCCLVILKHLYHTKCLLEADSSPLHRPMHSVNHLDIAGIGEDEFKYLGDDVVSVVILMAMVDVARTGAVM